MQCPYCSYKTLKVVDKRNNLADATIRRRRECLRCKKRFTTYEKIEHLDLFVKKSDGKIEIFDPNKVRKGILKALNKELTEKDSDIVEKIIDKIEQKIINSKSSSIKSSEIGKIVLDNLLKVDQLAYLRFASIYKHFKSVNDFDAEIHRLKSMAEAR